MRRALSSCGQILHVQASKAPTMEGVGGGGAAAAVGGAAERTTTTGAARFAHVWCVKLANYNSVFRAATMSSHCLKSYETLPCPGYVNAVFRTCERWVIAGRHRVIAVAAPSTYGGEPEGKTAISVRSGKSISLMRPRHKNCTTPLDRRGRTTVSDSSSCFGVHHFCPAQCCQVA